MGLYKTNTEELSYKQSAIKLVVVTIVSALIWHRYTMIGWASVPTGLKSMSMPKAFSFYAYYGLWLSLFILAL